MSLPASLPPIRDDEEWVLYVMASARTAVAASARQPLDASRFRNDGSYDAFVTEIAMEETGGGLLNLAIEITDSSLKRNLLRDQASCTTFGKVDPLGTTANNTVAAYVARHELPQAYRLQAGSGFNIVLEELAGTARTARVTVISYVRMPKPVAAAA